MNARLITGVVLSIALRSPSVMAAEHPTLQPGQDFSSQLFKMKSPNSSGWVGLSQNGSRIAFARSGTAATDSDIAAVILFPVPAASGVEDFVALVRKGVERDAPKPRFEVENTSLEVSPDRPYACVKYNATSIDHGEKTFVVPKRPLRLQLLSLYCRYPDNPGLGFAISFSHRGATPLLTFQQEAEEFIDGVQVTPTDKKP